jgi:hypothetical protein
LRERHVKCSDITFQKCKQISTRAESRNQKGKNHAVLEDKKWAG